MSPGYLFTFSLEKESYKVRFRKMIHQFRCREDEHHTSNGNNILYNNTNHTPPQKNPTKKRNYSESFGDRDYEFERYGQNINAEYFQTNIGHGVIG